MNRLKQMTLLVAFFLLSISSTFAQEYGVPITIKKNMGSNLFYQGEKHLTINQVAKILEANPETFQLMKSAKQNNIWSYLLGVPGAAMFGWQLGAATAGGDADWVMAGVGVGLVGLSIPFMRKCTKQSQQAVDLYNQSIGTTGYCTKTELGLTFTSDGVGLALHF